ncbi:MAG: hypothetical protein NC211_03815 [Alistipes senegalensis]|nr:hypothetical protein [Oxalobacter formigenes]MCM1280945.1 hypothetical protein [Alistipes senegalensis]
MSETLTVSAEPSFQPFSWLPEGDTKSTDVLIAWCSDVAYGIETILQIVEDNRLRNNNDEPGYFDDYYIGRLMRFATVSARLLGEAADAEIDRINREHQTAKKH